MRCPRSDSSKVWHFALEREVRRRICSRKPRAARLQRQPTRGEGRSPPRARRAVRARLTAPSSESARRPRAPRCSQALRIPRSRSTVRRSQRATRRSRLVDREPREVSAGCTTSDLRASWRSSQLERFGSARSSRVGARESTAGRAARRARCAPIPPPRRSARPAARCRVRIRILAHPRVVADAEEVGAGSSQPAVASRPSAAARSRARARSAEGLRADMRNGESVLRREVCARCRRTAATISSEARGGRVSPELAIRSGESWSRALRCGRHAILIRGPLGGPSLCEAVRARENRGMRASPQRAPRSDDAKRRCTRWRRGRGDDARHKRSPRTTSSTIKRDSAHCSSPPSTHSIRPSCAPKAPSELRACRRAARPPPSRVARPDPIRRGSMRAAQPFDSAAGAAHETGNAASGANPRTVAGNDLGRLMCCTPSRAGIEIDPNGASGTCQAREVRSRSDRRRRREAHCASRE
jgi:hypothetical protein